MRTGAYFKCSNEKQFASPSTALYLPSTPLPLTPCLSCSSWSPAKNGHLHNFHPVMGEKQRLRFEASLGLLIRCLPGLLHLLLPAPPPPARAPATSLLWSSDAAFNYQPTTAATLAGKTESERQKHRQKGKGGRESGKNRLGLRRKTPPGCCCQDIALYCAAS